jgi:hypothetical protein
MGDDDLDLFHAGHDRGEWLPESLVLFANDGAVVRASRFSAPKRFDHHLDDSIVTRLAIEVDRPRSSRYVRPGREAAGIPLNRSTSAITSLAGASRPSTPKRIGDRGSTRRPCSSFISKSR